MRREILKARAKVLARRPAPEESGGDYLTVVVFRLGSEIYGLELAYAQEVYNLDELTPVPCTPAFVAGIINVRGQILAVLDLKKLFKLPEQNTQTPSPALYSLPSTPNSGKAIILCSGSITSSILVDRVLGVETIPLKFIQPPLLTGQAFQPTPSLNRFEAEYIKGLTNAPLIILDAAKILSDERLIVHEEVPG